MKLVVVGFVCFGMCIAQSVASSLSPNLLLTKPKNSPVCKILLRSIKGNINGYTHLKNLIQIKAEETASSNELDIYQKQPDIFSDDNKATYMINNLRVAVNPASGRAVASLDFSFSFGPGMLTTHGFFLGHYNKSKGTLTLRHFPAYSKPWEFTSKIETQSALL